MVAPLVAVNCTVSPDTADDNDNAGVVSEVTLSVDDEPESDAATRSGASGAAGAEVSTVSGRAALAADVLPAASVRVAETDHVPSVRAGRSHDVEGCVNVQVSDVASFVAVTVVVSPAAPPLEDMVGVESEVMLSVDDEPESDPTARSGTPGTAGAVRSMVTVVPSEAAPGPTMPPDEVTDPLASRGITVPSAQPDTVTVKVDDDPTVGEVVKVHPPVPALLKSSEETVVASTVELKVSV